MALRHGATSYRATSIALARSLFHAGSIVIAAIALGASSVAVAQTPCADCGQVQSIRSVEEQGKGTGLGAVAGGVLGGVLGHQIGGGRGNTVATIAGAAGGAYVGNTVEKNKNAKVYWLVTLKMDGGTTRSFRYTNRPTVQEGERVKLVDGGKRLALIAN
jgi:outer membrane lipoprotein SlyB